MSMNDLGSYSSPGGYENWHDIEKGESGGGKTSNNSSLKGIGILLIVIGVIGAAVFPPIGILIWIGVKMAA